MKDKFNSLLLMTGRAGIQDLIDYMDHNGFYKAPCSTQYHLCQPGGLLTHSLNVYTVMNKIYQTLEPEGIGYDSIIIAALLHDLGKMGQYGKTYYEPNYLKSGELSSAKPFISSKSLLNVAHELRSVQIAEKFIELTEEEAFAIYYHNGLYTPLGNAVKGHETPLYMLLHSSDMWASRVIENEQ